MSRGHLALVDGALGTRRPTGDLGILFLFQLKRRLLFCHLLRTAYGWVGVLVVSMVDIQVSSSLA